MTRFTKLLLIVAVAAACPFAIAEEGDTTAEVEIGFRDTDVTDSPALAGEYEPVEDEPVFGIMVSTHQDWGTFLVEFESAHPDDMDASVEFDIHRTVRSHTSYTSLLHRLGHDPLSNLAATSTNGKVVLHSDFDPGADYGFSYSDLSHRTELQFPGASALTLAVGYREQGREGKLQALSTSHCDTCHIKSQTHLLDEETTDGTLEAKVAWRGGSLTGSATTREHRQRFPFVLTQYDDALHPELQVPVFDNRLQYDSDVGPVPADLWPEIDKDTARLDLELHDVAGFAVAGGAVWSETENRYNGLSSDYQGYMLNAARRFDNGIRLRWRGRVYSIDNDDVFIDTIERVSIAGPHAGQTYEDIYGVNYDHWRYSALNRDVAESKLDASYRFGRVAGTLRALWEFETIDRDTYEVLPSETETTRNILGVSWRSRPSSMWRVDASLRHAEIDNPFMLVNGGCSTLVSGQYPNPWDPETPQYDEFHEARIAETTASPSSWDELKAGVTALLGGSTLSATYRWWDGDNSDGDLTDWSRTAQTGTLTYWTAPAPDWELFLAYAWQQSELQAPACIPIFDG